MEELRMAYGSLGLEKVRTYVQSGNVVFEDPGTDALAVRGMIEKKVKQHFGFDVLVFIRTGDDMRDLVENTPFAGRDDGKLHVTFLSEKPENVPAEEMMKAKDRAEEFSVVGREVYLFCPNGYGNTRLSNSFFERKLKVSATTRNWRTVNALLSMASG